MGLAVLETRISFLDYVDDDAVSFFLSFVVLFSPPYFFLLLLHPGHFICFLLHLFGMCLPHFGFVIMDLHFATTFTIAMT